MKTKYFIYPLLMFSGLCACTPDEDELVDFSDFQIAKVELGADHRQLIADGISTLTLNPMLYQPYKIQTDDGRDTIVYGKIPVDRLAEGTVQYFLEDGTPLKEGKYRTTDLSKSEQGFYVTANGLKSDVFKVSIREPFAEDAYETITYPVVFHLIQDKTKVELGQGVGADIVNYAFNTIYNCFARTAAFSPNGADTKIRFRLAEYDPNGRKMEEKGINRYSLSTSDLNNLNPEKIKNNPKICWDYKRYLNIWIVENMAGSTASSALKQWGRVTGCQMGTASEEPGATARTASQILPRSPLRYSHWSVSRIRWLAGILALAGRVSTVKAVSI